MNEQTNETIDNKDLEANNENILDINADENMAGNTKMNEKMTDESDIELLKDAVNDWKDKYTRLAAEFDNYKKRSFKEKMEVIQTAGKDIILQLLEVLDDADRAQKVVENSVDVNAVKEGYGLVFNKMHHILTQKGLKSFESIGTEFDVEKHEAVTEITAPTPDMQGKVIDELQKGYLLNDKLIRHAKVVVGKSE